MSDIEFIRRHSLSIAKARALVQKVADALASEHSLSSEWRGDTLQFHRPGLHGEMHVSHSQIRLTVTLGLLLKPFRAAFLRHIERDFEKYLSEAPPASKRLARRATHRSE